MSGGIRKPGAVQNKRKTANQGTQNAASARGARNTNRSVSGGGIPKPGAARGGKKDGRALNGKARKMNKRYKVPLTILFVVFLVVIVFMSSFLSYTYLVDKYANPVSAESIALDEETSVKFRIDKGMSTRDIAEQLYDLGLIQNKTIYRFLSKFNGFDGQYKVGTYTLCEGLSYDEIMTLLAGEPETVRVTFPEGFTTEQIAARLEANNVVTADEFLAALETIDVSSYPFLSELAEPRETTGSTGICSRIRMSLT